MFDSQNNQEDQNGDNKATDATVAPEANTVSPVQPTSLPSSFGAGSDVAATAPSAPTSDDTSDTSGMSYEVSPAPNTPEPSSTTTHATDDNNSGLLSIKQEALQQLTPLVNHLDQEPEEKFRTLMMMIQASDDHSKLKEAYNAAKDIKDDKVRAQALLDVINEINYFTQNSSDQSADSSSPSL